MFYDKDLKQVYQLPVSDSVSSPRISIWSLVSYNNNVIVRAGGWLPGSHMSVVRTLAAQASDLRFSFQQLPVFTIFIKFVMAHLSANNCVDRDRNFM